MQNIYFIQMPYNVFTKHWNKIKAKLLTIQKIFYFQETTNEIKSKLNVKVYYETLCPASISFFSNQLKPVAEKLSSHVDVTLVPYGHASVRILSYFLTSKHSLISSRQSICTMSIKTSRPVRLLPVVMGNLEKSGLIHKPLVLFMTH